MPQRLPLAACGLLVACASSPTLVRSVPVDSSDEDSQLWAAVLREPLTADPPTLSDQVRHALVAPTETTPARLRADHDADVILATRILPLALATSMHPVLERAARRLRDGDAPDEVLHETLTDMRDRRITCRAYRGVLFGGHPGRDAARDENAFVALEIVYFHLHGERGAPADPIDCGNEAPTALLRPQLVPYLAVAAGAEPDAVRASVAELLEAMH